MRKCVVVDQTEYSVIDDAVGALVCAAQEVVAEGEDGAERIQSGTFEPEALRSQNARLETPGKKRFPPVMNVMYERKTRKNQRK
jgi:hypothetical protein